MLRLALLAAALWPAAAAAHTLSPGVAGFTAGALSLLTDPADVLGWLALALLAGTQAQRPAGWAAELFAAGLLGGLLLAWAGALPTPMQGVELVPLALCGGLLAAGRRPPVPVLFAVAAAAGLVRGWHDGIDTLNRPDRLALAAGLALCGLVLVTCTVATTAVFLRDPAPWRRITLRAAGSWVTAIAVMVGGFALRQ